MPDPVTGVVAGTSVIGGAIQSRAASRATRAQRQAANASIAEQRRQFDAMRALLQPYVNAGSPALQGLMDIAGISGPRFDAQSYFTANPDVAQEWARVQGEGRFNSPDEFAQWHFQNFGRNEGRQGAMHEGGQQAAFNAIEQSPGFQAIARQGEEAILQNASATGGLRGGNTQGALARFRPALLDEFINRQFSRLGNIASMGQNAAAGVGNAGMQTGVNIGNTLINRGQATAAGAGAQGQIFGNMIGQVGGMAANAFVRRPSPSDAFRLAPSAARTMAANPGIF